MESSKGNTMFLINKLNVNFKDEVCEVYELAEKHGLRVEFLEMRREGPIHQATFTYQVTAGDFTREGQAPTKTVAKKLAAQQVLVDLRSLPLPPSDSGNRRRKKKLWQAAPVFQPGSNPIVCLGNLLSKMRGKPAQYTLVNTDNESDLFYVQVIVADETAVGTGYSKKEAKKNAAAKMLRVLGYNFPYTEPVLNQATSVDRRQKEESQQTPQAAQEAALNAPVVTQDVTAHIMQESSVARCDTDQVEEDDRLTAEDLQLLSQEVLPLLAAMGLPEVNNEVFQSCQSKPTNRCQQVTTNEAQEVEEVQSQSVNLQLVPGEVTEDTSTVTRGDVPQLEEEVQSKSVDLELLPLPRDDSPEQPEEVLQEVLLKSPEVTWAEASTSTQENTSAVTEDVTSQVSQSNEPQREEEESQPAFVDLQALPLDIHPLLILMGVIKTKNGIVEWSEPNPILCCQENNKETIQPPVFSKTTIDGTESPSEISTGLNITLTTNGPEESSPSEAMTGPERSKTIAVPKNTNEGKISVILPGRPDTIPGSERNSLPAPPLGRPVSFILTDALVRNMFSMAGSCTQHSQKLMAVNLDKQIKDQLIVGSDTEISVDDLQKNGETAARSLAQEYGSPSNLLTASHRSKDSAFEEAVVNHLNTALRAFQNRPKSALSRFFSALRRAFIT